MDYWSRIYFPGERFSAAELSAAVLDGALCAVGLGYVAADTPVLPAVRVRSLIPVLDRHHAVCGVTAAWVHGALDDLPHPIELQRSVPWLTARVLDRRVRFHDTHLPDDDAVTIAGITVTNLCRTLADVSRDRHARAFDGARERAARHLALNRDVRRAALEWFGANRGRPHAKAAVAYLRGVDRRGL